MEQESELTSYFYWSKIPGRFINKLLGLEVRSTLVENKKEWILLSETVNPTSLGTPKTMVRIYEEREVLVSTTSSFGTLFKGTVREWNETLVQLIFDQYNLLFKRLLQAPNFLEVGSDVFPILENCAGYSAVYGEDKVNPCLRGKVVGRLNNRLGVVLVETMPANEISVVLVTDHKIVLPELQSPEGTYNILDSDLEMLPATTRFDGFVIRVLDTNWP